jgi:hypothetical protein
VLIARATHLVRETPTTLLLLATNLIPLAGVAFWGWHLGTVMVLYWLENGIVGVINVPRMALAAIAADERANPRTAGRDEALDPIRLARLLGGMARIPFFIVHYGIFWVVHGIFVWGLFAGPGLFGPATIGTTTVGTGVDSGAVATGFVGLALYHVVSFIYWDVIRREYASKTPAEIMFQPYPRLIVLHLTIILGAFLVVFTGQPIAALVLLVLLKTAIELGGQTLFSHQTSPTFNGRNGR